MRRGKEMTRRQADTLASAKALAEKHGVSPTLSEIADDLDIGISTVERHLNALEMLGHLSREVGRARSIRFTSPTPEAVDSETAETLRDWLAYSRCGASSAALARMVAVTEDILARGKRAIKEAA